MSTDKSSCRIAIVGGGIAGLCAAIGLGKAGYDVHIFEQAAKFAEIGAGVAIGGNSYRALQLMGLGEGYAKVADVEPENSTWFEFVTWDRREHISAPVSKPSYTSIHRARFLDELLQHLPKSVTVHFGTKIAGAENFDENSPHPEAANGATERRQGVRLTLVKAKADTHPDYPSETESFECDVCIGCDGVKSKVRDALDLGGIVRYTGSYAYRGLLPADKAKEVSGDKVALPKMWCGKDKHILIFPIEGGKVLNLVAFVTDRSQPEDKRFHSGAWVTPSSLDEMQKDYQGWDEQVTKLFPLIEKPEHWALHDLLPLQTWIKGRVTLIGDAAHASLPHNGAGAGQAIEDAYILSELFKHPACNAETAPVFLEAFQSVRLPRANRQMVHSRRSGDLYEYSSEYGDDISAIGKDMDTRWNWIWDHDHKADVEQAFEYVRSKGIIS